MDPLTQSESIANSLHYKYVLGLDLSKMDKSVAHTNTDKYAGVESSCFDELSITNLQWVQQSVLHDFSYCNALGFCVPH